MGAKGDGVRHLGEDQHGGHRASGRNRCKAHGADGAYPFQPAVQADTPQPAALEPEERDLHGHRHGPERPDGRLAIPQMGQVQRQEGIEHRVRQHGEEGGCEKPGHLGPSQQVQRRRGRLIVHRRVAHDGHAPGHHQQQPVQRRDDPGKGLDTESLQQRADTQHRQDEPDRPPNPHPAIAPGIQALPRIQKLRQGRFLQGNDPAVEHEQRRSDEGDDGETFRHQQPKGGQDASGGRHADQLHSAPAVITQPGPGVGRQHPRPRLQRGDQPDGERREPQLGEPQPGVGAERGHAGEVGEGQRPEGEQRASTRIGRGRHIHPAGGRAIQTREAAPARSVGPWE